MSEPTDQETRDLAAINELIQLELAGAQQAAPILVGPYTGNCHDFLVGREP